ncbi:MAG: hypothetical protein ACRETX_02845, partial [Steroidobacteraceae bacterium]
LFLYFGLTTFCDYVLPDRVEFPHPAGGLCNSEYVLYPVEKSPLETQLDLFFDLEASEHAKMIYPQYLFEFDRFVELYCVSMLPYQAFIGAITWREHLGLAFNPRQLKIFGRA